MEEEVNENFDFEKMSKKTGTPVEVLKTALGVPLDIEHGITTMEQAHMAYFKTARGSRDRLVMLRKMVELASTASDFAQLWRQSIMGELKSDERARVIYQCACAKWDALSLKEVELASTFAEAKEAYFNAPLGDDVRMKAFEKMLKLATTLDEVQDVYSRAPDIGEAKKLATHKLAIFYTHSV
jgi:hypothetical protein